jgi:hypothetical protein
MINALKKWVKQRPYGAHKVVQSAFGLAGEQHNNKTVQFHYPNVNIRNVLMQEQPNTEIDESFLTARLPHVEVQSGAAPPAPSGGNTGNIHVPIGDQYRVYWNCLCISSYGESLTTGATVHSFGADDDDLPVQATPSNIAWTCHQEMKIRMNGLAYIKTDPDNMASFYRVADRIDDVQTNAPVDATVTEIGGQTEAVSGTDARV